MALMFGQFVDDFQRFWQYSVNYKKMEMVNFVNNSELHEVSESDVVGGLILLSNLSTNRDLTNNN